METTFLKSFVLMVETGSMAEAARRQDLTPAAVAQQVRALERELDVPLIARSGRTVKPTPAGYLVYESAVKLLREVGSLYALVREDGVAGKLRLGTINTAVHTILPRILGSLARNYPELTVFIQSGMSQQLLAAVQSDQLDAAVCLHPEYVLSKSMAWELLREEPLVVLAPREFANRDPIELLKTEPLLRYDRALGGGKQADLYLQKHKIVPKERFELSSLLAIALMVSEGLGISLVPDIASPLTSGLKTVCIPLSTPTEPRRFGVLWRRGSSRARLIEAFIAQARQDAKTL
ncbi:MAG: LysR family transcriptional regulator [Burkholderiaceae bacterium]